MPFYAFAAIAIGRLDPIFRCALPSGTRSNGRRAISERAHSRLRLAVHPLLWPAIFAGAVVVATSIDDFVLASFLSFGANSETVPIRIDGSARGGATSALNPIATLMLVITMTVIALGLVVPGTSRSDTAGRERTRWVSWPG